MHILGHLSDDRIIEQINEEDINCLLTLEMVDFTVCEYIRDAPCWAKTAAFLR